MAMIENRSGKKAWWEVLSTLTPLILGICITGVGLFFTHLYNFRQLQLNQITALEKFRDELVSDDPYKREFAYASFVALGYEDLALKLIKLKRDTAGRTVVQDVRESGSAAAKAEAEVTLQSIPAVVYLQIGSDAQRKLADKIRETLLQKGYEVPAIENMADKAVMPVRTNVRYFNDQDSAVAEQLVTILKQNGIASAYALRVRLRAKPGSLEIWFSPRDGG